jgi:hypothetical protein
LPAEWQETVKHRNRQPWERWVRRVMAGPDAPPRRRARWFWQVHDTAGVLHRWSAGLPPERVHVVTVPPPGSPSNLIWERLAAVLGVDPASVDLTAARPNASLGLAEVEMLRRLNTVLHRDAVPDWFYAVHVKEALAHGVLAERPVTLRPALAPRQAKWAHERAVALVADLRSAGYRVVGDLAELIPAAPAERRAERMLARSSRTPPQEVLDAALAALADVLRREYTSPDSAPGRASPTGSRAGWAPSPRTKRLLRRLASRYAWVRELRVLAWRLKRKPGRRG